MNNVKGYEDKGDFNFDEFLNTARSYEDSMQRAEENGTMHLLLSPYREGGPADPNNPIYNKNIRKDNQSGSGGWPWKTTCVVLSGCTLGVVCWQSSELRRRLVDLWVLQSDLLIDREDCGSLQNQGIEHLWND